jgi:UDP-N-acetylglucosamine:LPS N-acetylglucosamine transferase
MARRKMRANLNHQTMSSVFSTGFYPAVPAAYAAAMLLKINVPNNKSSALEALLLWCCE